MGNFSKIINTIYMKFALHTSTAISSVLKEPEHFYVDIYYLIILIIVAFTLLLLSFLRYHLYKTKKEKELREIASLVDKNEILIQRYSVRCRTSRSNWKRRRNV